MCEELIGGFSFVLDSEVATVRDGFTSVFSGGSHILGYRPPAPESIMFRIFARWSTGIATMITGATGE